MPAEELQLAAPLLLGCLAVILLTMVKGLPSIAADGRWSKLAERHFNEKPVSDWSLDAATGLLLFGVLLFGLGPSAGGPQWMFGALAGLVSGIAAYVLVRPDGFDSNVRNAALSLAGHALVGALLAALLLAGVSAPASAAQSMSASAPRVLIHR